MHSIIGVRALQPQGLAVDRFEKIFFCASGLLWSTACTETLDFGRMNESVSTVRLVVDWGKCRRICAPLGGAMKWVTEARATDGPPSPVGRPRPPPSADDERAAKMSDETTMTTPPRGRHSDDCFRDGRHDYW